MGVFNIISDQINNLKFNKVEPGYLLVGDKEFNEISSTRIYSESQYKEQKEMSVVTFEGYKLIIIRVFKISFCEVLGNKSYKS